MKTWQKCCAGLATLVGLIPEAWAQQFPGIPSPTPLPPPPMAPAGIPAVPAAPPNNLFNFLCLSPAQTQACQQALCQSQLGLLHGSTLAPVNVISGGVVPASCPALPSAAELNSPGAVGAAAKIKKDEAEAKARRAAVRYLGTASCPYWPEAEAALIGSLRGDRNEGVRWEAAMALASGRCTKRTIAALAITVSGSEKDGKPAETSARVRAAAQVALNHCLECYKEVVPAPVAPVKPPEGLPLPTPEGPGGVKQLPAAGTPVATDADNPTIYLPAYYIQVESKPIADVVAGARSALTEAMKTSPKTESVPIGSRGVYQIIVNSAHLSRHQDPTAPPAEGDGRLVPSQTALPPVTAEPRAAEVKAAPHDLWHLLIARRQARALEKPPVETMALRQEPPKPEAGPTVPAGFEPMPTPEAPRPAFQPLTVQRGGAPGANGTGMSPAVVDQRVMVTELAPAAGCWPASIPLPLQGPYAAAGSTWQSAPANPGKPVPGASSYHPLDPTPFSARPGTTSACGKPPVETVAFRQEPTKMEAAPSVSAAVAPGPTQDQPRRELQSPATATGTTPVPAAGPGVTPYAPAGPDGLAAPTQHPAPASLVKTAPEASSYHPLDPAATPTRPGAISLTAKPSAAVTPYSPAAPVAAGGSSGPPSATNLADLTPAASSYHPLAAAVPPAQTQMTPSLAKSPVVPVVYRQEPMKPEAAACMSVAAVPPATPEEPRRDLRLPAAVPEPRRAVAPRPAIIPATAVATANPVPRGQSPRADSAKAVLPAQPGTPYFRGLLVIIQESKSPSQREWAAKTLAEIDWPTRDAAVGALLDAVRQDPSATVRAMCIRCLAQKNVQSAPVRQLLQQLKTDLSAGNDPRVQYEAAQALAHLDGSGAAPSAPAIPTTEAP